MSCLTYQPRHLPLLRLLQRRLLDGHVDARPRRDREDDDQEGVAEHVCIVQMQLPVRTN